MDEFIKHINLYRPSDIREVEKILQVQFVRNDVSSNDFYSIFETGETKKYKDIEVRLPNNKFKSKECIIIFSLYPDNEYSRESIMKKNTDVSGFRLVPPQPTDLGRTNYYSYDLETINVAYEFKGDNQLSNRIILKYKL